MPIENNTNNIHRNVLLLMQQQKIVRWWLTWTTTLSSRLSRSKSSSGYFPKKKKKKKIHPRETSTPMKKYHNQINDIRGTRTFRWRVSFLTNPGISQSEEKKKTKKFHCNFHCDTRRKIPKKRKITSNSKEGDFLSLVEIFSPWNFLQCLEQQNSIGIIKWNMNEVRHYSYSSLINRIEICFSPSEWSSSNKWWKNHSNWISRRKWNNWQSILSLTFDHLLIIIVVEMFRQQKLIEVKNCKFYRLSPKEKWKKDFQSIGKAKVLSIRICRNGTNLAMRWPINSSPFNSSHSNRRVQFVADQFVALSIRRNQFVAYIWEWEREVWELEANWITRFILTCYTECIIDFKYSYVDPLAVRNQKKSGVKIELLNRYLRIDATWITRFDSSLRQRLTKTYIHKKLNLNYRANNFNIQ